MDMAVQAFSAFATVSEYRKVSTDWSRGVDADMSIATRRVRTFATKEMEAGWDTLWGRVVGEIAGISCRTSTCLEEVSAHGHSCSVVNVDAIGALEAST